MNLLNAESISPYFIEKSIYSSVHLHHAALFLVAVIVSWATHFVL